MCHESVSVESSQQNLSFSFSPFPTENGPLSWLQITGIVLGCVSVLLAICKCCFSCMDKGCANDTPVAETTQDVEEPAGEPLNPDPNGAEKPPAYDDVGHFPKSQAQGDTSV